MRLELTFVSFGEDVRLFVPGIVEIPSWTGLSQQSLKENKYEGQK